MLYPSSLQRDPGELQMTDKSYFADASPGRICKKCLLRDMPEQAFFDNLTRTIERLDEDLKVPGEVYQQRLSTCTSCEELLNGMCRLCGCYVELRAVMKKNGCPRVPPRWLPEERIKG